MTTKYYQMKKIMTDIYRKVIKKKRKGVHAKSKTSNLKSSINYKKAYKGQGR